MPDPCWMDLSRKVVARYREKVARFEAMAPAGSVGVDSGTLIVIDPAYLKYWGTGEHPELAYDSVLNAGPAKQLHFNNGIPAGVLLSNFGGDGSYQVFREPSGENGTGSFAVDFSRLAARVAARYKSKKKLESGNTVYLYSERQIARRNADKARRLEGLRSNISKLRTQVAKDLKSSDPDRFLTALAIALIDETYERVGNEESADDGHFGVTGWKKNHISFGKGTAKIKYVGKSGVKHEKKVSTKAVVNALRDAYEACEDGNIFCHDTGSVDAGKVNAYLKKFDITAKDLRGFHANREMQERLRAARKGVLSEDKKERAKQLKAEFKKALEETAEAVGHEPSTLKSQYLVPGLEEQYLKDGTVLDKMTKEAKAVGPEAPPEAPFGLWAWASHRKGMPNEPDGDEPDTDLEREVYGHIRKHFASDRTGLPKDTVELLVSCVEQGWYKSVLHPPPHDTLYRGLKIGKAEILAKLIGEEISPEGAIDFDEPRPIFLVDAEGEPDNGYSSSWTAHKKITRDFSEAGKRGWAVTLFANTADNPNRFLAGPGGLYNVDGLSRWHLEKETVGLEPILIRRIEWKPLSTVTERVAARFAAEVRKQDLQQWASDLRRMTKIYRSIPEQEDEAKRLVMFREARELFSTFRKNFELWVYRHVLPVPDKNESWIIKQVREKAWSAIVALREMLFPKAWNYQTEAHEDAPWKVKDVIDTNVRRYQKAFNEAFKVLEEYLQDEERRTGKPVERAPLEEKYSVAGMNVVIRGFGRIGEYEDDVDVFMRRLDEFARRIARAGFGDALKGLTVFIDFADFDRGTKTEGLVAGQYNSSKDSLQIFPLGFIASDGGTFTHEVGHRFWFRQLPGNARAHWTERLDDQTVEITAKDVQEFSQEYLTPKYQRLDSSSELRRVIEHQETDPERRKKFEALAQSARPVNWTNESVHRLLMDSGVGEKVHLEPISEYATTNPTEAFAEAFRIYIIEGPGRLGEWTRWFFREVTRSGGAKLASLFVRSPST